MDHHQTRSRSSTNLSQFGWYHGRLDRSATLTLLGKTPVGTFLVRDSSSIPGDYVISVSDDSVKGGCTHYIVNSVNGRYFAGEVYFPSLPAVIEHYQQNTLGRCALGSHVPTSRPPIPVKPDSIGEQSTLDKPATNKVPVPRPPAPMKPDFCGEQSSSEKSASSKFSSSSLSLDSGSSSSAGASIVGSYPESTAMTCIDEGNLVGHHRLPFTPEEPAQAIAVFARTVNAYDPTSLVFEIGDRIIIREQKPSGTWIGECNGLVGHFPFTAVQLCRQ
ncbi:adapter molecule crk-like [Sycon ciliatum]|uniref:adapter molecule crk-like n=1 Tax=Sycon ciliatum TaxID=27933 RepID=UPI0031F6CA21